jgi:hypothetical protein
MQEEECSLLLSYSGAERPLLQKPSLVSESAAQRGYVDYVHMVMTKLGFVARDKPELTWRAMSAARSRAFSVKVCRNAKTPRRLAETPRRLAETSRRAAETL